MKQILLKKVCKSFINNSYLIKDLELNLTNEIPIIIKGNNGSGKSTLIQIIANLILIDSGKIEYIIDNKNIKSDNIYKYFAYSSPNISLIDEFTVKYFFEWLYKLKPLYLNCAEIIKEFNLEKISSTKLYNLSSGMYQRINIIQAFLTISDFLILDEPCMNFDKNGYELYYELIKKFKKNRMLIIASNNNKEYEFEHKTIQTENFIK